MVLRVVNLYTPNPKDLLNPKLLNPNPRPLNPKLSTPG